MTCEMGRERIPFGQHRGKTLDELPLGYVKWLITADFAEAWLKQAASRELARRGERFVSAETVLAELEERLTRAVASDAGLSHEIAGRLADHVLAVFEVVRQRYGIGSATELDVGTRSPQRSRRRGHEQ